MKVQPTKRRFYNRWSYKVSLVVPYAIRLRSSVPLDGSSRDVLKRVEKLLSSIPKHERAFRTENSTVDIYVNCQEMFNRILVDFDDLIFRCFAPVPGTEELLDKPRSTLVNKLPHDRYQFKVYLQPHNFASVDDKQKFLNWLEQYTPRVLISESVKRWFLKTKWNWDRRYIYIQDEQIVLLIRMRHANAIGQVYSYQISDK